MYVPGFNAHIGNVRKDTYIHVWTMYVFVHAYMRKMYSEFSLIRRNSLSKNMVD